MPHCAPARTTALMAWAWDEQMEGWQAEAGRRRGEAWHWHCTRRRLRAPALPAPSRCLAPSLHLPARRCLSSAHGLSWHKFSSVLAGQALRLNRPGGASCTSTSSHIDNRFRQRMVSHVPHYMTEHLTTNILRWDQTFSTIWVNLFPHGAAKQGNIWRHGAAFWAITRGLQHLSARWLPPVWGGEEEVRKLTSALCPSKHEREEKKKKKKKNGRKTRSTRATASSPLELLTTRSRRQAATTQRRRATLRQKKDTYRQHCFLLQTNYWYISRSNAPSCTTTYAPNYLIRAPSYLPATRTSLRCLFPALLFALPPPQPGRPG